MKSNIPGGLILLYHRIASLDRDPQMLCVSPENFQRHLEILRERLRIVPLAEIAGDVAAGRSPDGKAAITFDDGYADNVLTAAPILRRHDAPATIFATTGHTNSCNEFFWDELDRIFLSPGELPAQLRIWLPQRPYEIDLGPDAVYTDADAQSHRRWTVLQKSDPTSRHRAYRELCTLLHDCTASRRRQVLEQLQAWAGMRMRRSHRMMSAQEMRGLAETEGIQIGGHTVDHPRMSVEPRQSQGSQLRENNLTLEWITGQSIRAFSYPFGTRRDFTGETMSLVKAQGYQFACANFEGRVTAGADLFALPRMIVRDWAAGEFAEKLERCVGVPVAKAA
jgi:peptidoglycan/xylan/chitin deacetylase (PgdA/CDA1 family)